MNVFLLFLVSATAAVVMWRLGRRGIGFGLGVFALLPAWALLRQLPWPVYLIATLAAAVGLWHHLSRSAAVVTRWSGRSRRSSGTASAATIARVASARAMRRKARKVRPVLAEVRWWVLWRVPVIGFAIELCRTGLQTVWCSIEDVTLVFGGPRTGKTGWLACRIIDAPGAVVVTSTRTDLLELCGPLRAAKGPVYVFNAVGLGGIPSTVTFDPLTGCTDPNTAAERATDMVSAASKGGSGDREFWDAQAIRALALLLHAAALGGKQLVDVKRWIGNPAAAHREVTGFLQRSSVRALVEDAAQFLGTNDKTQSSITTTMALALNWLNNREAAKAAAPGHSLDVAKLLQERATVFLLGAEETQVASLMCALTGHIARQARAIAAASEAGRLDPPLGLYLDEAFLICPVPLDSWTADMGGRNVTILAVFQSRQQMLDRYGKEKTGQIMTNAAAKVVFGGTGDRDDLIFWSTLAGDRDEPIWTTDPYGRGRSKTVRSVPVVAPAQIANLPEGRVLVFRRGIRPVLGRARMAWHRADVRAVQYPDAYTVRARAWTQRQCPRLATSLADLTRPTRRWVAAAVGACCTWIGAQGRGAGGWCRARWAALRLRVTGRRAPDQFAIPSAPSGLGPESLPQGPRLPAQTIVGGSGGAVIPFRSPYARPPEHGLNHSRLNGRGLDDDAIDDGGSR
ncbi:MAG: TraM recognition domain-containing protein [Pseudonocardia sp.]|uniref:type IV secretory system conjugative DNA transfer family protein n=1 Tax=Pseudonocardia sp. TaxID=60912 RepID=UPI001ACA62AA|nr:TraM recognition domain-containing protein [Pseudonocardia sp.]MBN9099396.1 TraM recognition domain-containing protein [Pseudonocardia sp.]